MSEKNKKTLEENMYQLKRVILKGRFRKIDTVGIVIPHLDFYGNVIYEIINLKEEKITVRLDDFEEVLFKPVRVKKEIRDHFTNFAKEYKKIFNIKYELQIRLNAVNKNADIIYHNFLNGITEITGMLNDWDFGRAIARQIPSNEKYDSTGCNMVGDKMISVYISLFIEKYASPEKYGFLDRMYDGNIVVIDEIMEDFPLYKKYNEKNPIDISSLKKARGVKDVKVSPSFDVGDKNTLYFDKTIYITFDKNVEYTKEYAKQVGEALAKGFK